MICYDVKYSYRYIQASTSSWGLTAVRKLPPVQGPVVQSIVSLTTSLRRHFVKYMLTTLSNPLSFFVEKMCESFAVQKILTFFQQKITVDLQYSRLKF